MSEERRWSDDELGKFHAEFLDLKTKFERWMDKDFPEHSRDEAAWRQMISGAFPKNKDGGPDVVGHCLAHEADIRASRAKEKFYSELTVKLVTSGIWAMVVIIAGLIFMGIKSKLGIGGPPP